MAIMTRCNKCRCKIEFGKTYCDKCKSIVGKEKRDSRSIKTKEADKFTDSSIWKALRAEIKRRDKGVCRLCLLNGKIEYRTLQVHHIHKRSEVPLLAYEPDNLVTLCMSCHNEIEELSPRKQFELVKMKYVEAPMEQGLDFRL